MGPALMALVQDPEVDTPVRRSVAHALGALADDVTTVRALGVLLAESNIADSVHSAMWMISRRAGVRVYGKEEHGSTEVLVEPTNLSDVRVR